MFSDGGEMLRDDVVLCIAPSDCCELPTEFSPAVGDETSLLGRLLAVLKTRIFFARLEGPADVVIAFN